VHPVVRLKTRMLPLRVWAIPEQLLNLSVPEFFSPAKSESQQCPFLKGILRKMR